MEQQQKKRFPWAKLVLAVSLALNLLVVGGLLRARSWGKARGTATRCCTALAFGPFAQALPSADRREMTKALLGKAGPLRENRREIRREFEAFLDLLRSGDLSEEELRLAIQRQQARVAERQELGKELLVQRILAMTPEARAAYADELDKAMRKRPKPFKKPKGD